MTPAPILPQEFQEKAPCCLWRTSRYPTADRKSTRPTSCLFLHLARKAFRAPHGLGKGIGNSQKSQTVPFPSQPCWILLRPTRRHRSREQKQGKLQEGVSNANPEQLLHPDAARGAASSK